MSNNLLNICFAFIWSSDLSLFSVCQDSFYQVFHKMSSITRFPGLLWRTKDKFAKLREIIKQNGGWRSSISKMYIMDDLKDGKLVGKDKYGNKYFCNPRYFYGRNRWVEYAEHQRLDYDGSQIPAEWFGWLHYKTDNIPHKDCLPNYSWLADHSPNLSGTKYAYTPYTTTPPKIRVWSPPKKCGSK